MSDQSARSGSPGRPDQPDKPDQPDHPEHDGLLARRAVRLGRHAADRFAAVELCGRVLVEIGAVRDEYVEAMLRREKDISTYIGEGVAIPHGTNAGKQAVLRDALAVVSFAEPVDWDGFPVSVCVAIAAQGDGHLEILGELAEILLDADRAAELRQATETDDVIRLLSPEGKAVT
jgi:mannitol PTS system EIIA component